jgi:hypothetical protein
MSQSSDQNVNEPPRVPEADPVQPAVEGSDPAETTVGGLPVTIGDPRPEIGEPKTGDVFGPNDIATFESLPAGSALLFVIRGPESESRILLDRDVVTVGRSPESDIFLDDVTVSRKHAEFVRTEAGYTLRDAGSLNGTYVDKRLVDKHELVPGDEVQIGKFRMVYQAHVPEQPAPEQPAQAPEQP